MNGFEPFTMCFGHQCAINLIREERSKRRHHFGNGYETFEKSLIRSGLVRPEFSFPKAAPVPSHIPIRKLFDCEIAHESSGARRVVTLHCFDVLADGGVE